LSIILVGLRKRSAGKASSLPEGDSQGLSTILIPLQALHFGFRKAQVTGRKGQQIKDLAPAVALSAQEADSTGPDGVKMRGGKTGPVRQAFHNPLPVFQGPVTQEEGLFRNPGQKGLQVGQPLFADFSQGKIAFGGVQGCVNLASLSVHHGADHP